MTFAALIASREPYERRELLDALQDIQTGKISLRGDPSLEQWTAGSWEALLPNVRLANGTVNPTLRNRLMLAFNTPFFPEILVASSVMAEGVDLHLNCRHVIHHDLDWNPSVIEQRTGRVDRIRSKAEVTGQPIRVYEPFLEGKTRTVPRYEGPRALVQRRHG